MNHQECRVRPEMIYVNSNKLSFYSCGIKVNKFSGSCNNIIDSCAKLCVPDALKDINVKVFNLMSKTNETRYKKGMKLANVNVDQFVIMNNVRMKIHADVNAKN